LRCYVKLEIDEYFEGTITQTSSSNNISSSFNDQKKERDFLWMFFGKLNEIPLHDD
jgi:hypothetical protein